MRLVLATAVTLAVGIGVGLLVYGLATPTYDATIEVVRDGKPVDLNTRNFLYEERRRATDRASTIGVGSGFLAAGGTGLILVLVSRIGARTGMDG